MVTWVTWVTEVTCGDRGDMGDRVDMNHHQLAAIRINQYQSVIIFIIVTSVKSSLNTRNELTKPSNIM